MERLVKDLLQLARLDAGRRRSSCRATGGLSHSRDADLSPSPRRGVSGSYRRGAGRRTLTAIRRSFTTR